jgi:hypothetical protein
LDAGRTWQPDIGCGHLQKNTIVKLDLTQSNQRAFQPFFTTMRLKKSGFIMQYQTYLALLAPAVLGFVPAAAFAQEAETQPASPASTKEALAQDIVQEADDIVQSAQTSADATEESISQNENQIDTLSQTQPADPQPVNAAKEEQSKAQETLEQADADLQEALENKNEADQTVQQRSETLEQAQTDYASLQAEDPRASLSQFIADYQEDDDNLEDAYNAMVQTDAGYCKLMNLEPEYTDFKQSADSYQTTVSLINSYLQVLSVQNADFASKYEAYCDSLVNQKILEDKISLDMASEAEKAQLEQVVQETDALLAEAEKSFNSLSSTSNLVSTYFNKYPSALEAVAQGIALRQRLEQLNTRPDIEQVITTYLDALQNNAELISTNPGFILDVLNEPEFDKKITMAKAQMTWSSHLLANAKAVQIQTDNAYGQAQTVQKFAKEQYDAAVANTAAAQEVYDKQEAVYQDAQSQIASLQTKNVHLKEVLKTQKAFLKTADSVLERCQQSVFEEESGNPFAYYNYLVRLYNSLEDESNLPEASRPVQTLPANPNEQIATEKTVNGLKPKSSDVKAGTAAAAPVLPLFSFIFSIVALLGLHAKKARN